MSVSPDRLRELLAADGFKPIWVDTLFGSFRFGRIGSFPGLFEQVWINTQGKTQEAVTASVAVSVVNSNTATRGLFEERHLSEVDTHEFRAYSNIENKEDALAWEKRLGQVASDAVLACARAQAQGLLQRTARVRDLIDRYESTIGSNESLDNLETLLKRKATAEQLQAAAKLAEWPGVCQFRGGQVLYEIACLMLILFAEKVEAKPDFFAKSDPLLELEVMWRIQVLTDRLLRRFGHAEDYWS
jgi:hypothetical protein